MNYLMNSFTHQSCTVIDFGVDIDIQQHSIYGRVLVCLRNFSVNDIVLIEKPILVYSDLFDLLVQYVQLDETVRNKLSHLQSYASLSSSSSSVSSEAIITYPLFSEKLTAIQEIANEALNRVSSIACFPVTIDDLFCMLTTSIINCHGFPGYSVFCATSGKMIQKDSALFEIASKAAHSCLPNCIYTNFRPHGMLTYFSHRSMIKGDLISFCYVDYMCTRARRNRLMTSKNFLCHCSKCDNPDYSYGVRCEVTGCCGTTLPTCTDLDFSATSTWLCLQCGSSEAPCNLDECLESAESNFTTIKSMYIVNGERFFSQGPISMLDDFILDTTSNFCPTHYLVTEALLEKVELLLQGIISLEGKISDSLLSDMRVQAAQALFSAVQTMECVENMCLMGTLCDRNHLATHHGTGHILRACLELVKCHASVFTTGPFSLAVRKYFYLLKGVYGPDDSDVIKIKNIFDLS